MAKVITVREMLGITANAQLVTLGYYDIENMKYITSSIRTCEEWKTLLSEQVMNSDVVLVNTYIVINSTSEYYNRDILDIAFHINQYRTHYVPNLCL